MHDNGRKRALVVDAGTETGREVALSLARDGFDVALVGQNLDVLSQVECVCNEHEGNVFSLEGNGPSRPPSKVVAEAVERLGGIDVLVNRPGLICPMLSSRTNLDDWTLLADANLTSAGQFSLLALPWLVRSPNATVIFIASIASRFAAETWAGYYASKQATSRLFELFQPSKLIGRVCTICPGYLSPLSNRHLPSSITTLDVAEAVCYLAKPIEHVHAHEILATFSTNEYAPSSTPINHNLHFWDAENGTCVKTLHAKIQAHSYW